MSLEIITKGSRNYAYFYPGRDKKIYLGPVDKICAERALTALEYLKEKSSHYSNIEQKIVLMLPEKERKQYVQKRISAPSLASS